ncbi:probable G-protein coupled receptor 146 isoform X2 [Alosa sapidissima]|uniref:probable G-protein coupled receptor 146 isoform X2 n=1 Tax=Alosa sapidissima TaxID=34773 RepID=UPI001C084D52|nr:probable G-protein coupled receptor 146 isoform X2 [Alosa sapidissima]
MNAHALKDHCDLELKLWTYFARRTVLTYPGLLDLWLMNINFKDVNCQETEDSVSSWLPVGCNGGGYSRLSADPSN